MKWRNETGQCNDGDGGGIKWQNDRYVIVMKYEGNSSNDNY